MLSITDFLAPLHNRRHRCWFYELIFHVNPIISLCAFVFMHICTYYYYLCDWCSWARYKWGKNVNNLRTTGTVIDNFDGGGKQRYSHSQMTPCCTGNNGQFFDASWRQNIVAVLYETRRAPRKRYIIYTRTDGLWTRQSYGSPVQQQRRSCRVTTRRMSVVRGRAFKTVYYYTLSVIYIYI